MKLILLGIQGSGKSTQGNLLGKKLGLPYLSTGHIFRELAKEHTLLGRKIKETMNAGYLIPDRQVLKIVSEYLKRPEYEKGYILDGFPRTVKQAENFQNGIDKVIYLNVSDREALWRLSFRNNDDAREDESLAAIRKRIMLYHKYTDPVLGFYKKQSKLIEINGEKRIMEIQKEIIEELGLKNHKKINNSSAPVKNIIALVGLPGAGKSQASNYFREKNTPVIRFGEITDQALKEKGLPQTEEHEKNFREDLRQKLGMAAFAIKNEPKIREALQTSSTVVLDGLRSWEEYIYLKEKFKNLYLLAIYASPHTRYKRLKERCLRGVSEDQAKKRDVAELDKLHLAPTIILSNYLIKNETTLKELYAQLEKFFNKIAS